MSQKEVPKKNGGNKLFWKVSCTTIFIILNKDPCPTVKIGQICHIQYLTKMMIPLGRLEFIIPKINYIYIYIYIYIKFVVNMKDFPKTISPRNLKWS
jgi:hypothetical protein